MNNNNLLVVASFKNIDGEVIKSICFNQNVIFNEGMVPEVATAYYLYSKKEDGKFSNDSSCHIGMPLREAITNDRENIKLLAFLAMTTKECGYLCIDGKENVFQIEENMAIVNNYGELVSSFKNDIEKVKTSGRQFVKKM